MSKLIVLEEIMVRQECNECKRYKSNNGNCGGKTGVIPCVVFVSIDINKNNVTEKKPESIRKENTISEKIKVTKEQEQLSLFDMVL